MRTIVNASHHQIANSPAGRAIVAAGLSEQLASLIHQIAANAANPIAADFEDAYSMDVAESAAGR